MAHSQYAQKKGEERGGEGGGRKLSHPFVILDTICAYCHLDGFPSFFFLPFPESCVACSSLSLPQQLSFPPRTARRRDTNSLWHSPCLISPVSRHCLSDPVVGSHRWATSRASAQTSQTELAHTCLHVPRHGASPSFFLSLMRERESTRGMIGCM